MKPKITLTVVWLALFSLAGHSATLGISPEGQKAAAPDIAVNSKGDIAVLFFCQVKRQPAVHVRVVEIASFVAAPSAGALLADLTGNTRADAVLWNDEELFVLAPRGGR